MEKKDFADKVQSLIERWEETEMTFDGYLLSHPFVVLLREYLEGDSVE